MDKQGSYNSLSCSRYDSSIYVTSLVSKNGELSEEKFDIYYWLLSNGKITMVNRDFSLNTNTNYEYRIETKIDLDEKELIEKHINLAEDWIGVNLYCVEKFANPTFDQIEMLGTIVKSCEIYSMRFQDQNIFDTINGQIYGIIEITLISTNVSYDKKYIGLFGYLKESALIPYQIIMTQKLIDLDKDNKNGRIYGKDFLKEVQSKKINIRFPEINVSKQNHPLSDLKLNFSNHPIKDKYRDKLDMILNMYDIMKRDDTARLFNMVYGKENQDE